MNFLRGEAGPRLNHTYRSFTLGVRPLGSGTAFAPCKPCATLLVRNVQNATLVPRFPLQTPYPALVWPLLGATPVPRFPRATPVPRCGWGAGTFLVRGSGTARAKCSVRAVVLYARSRPGRSGRSGRTIGMKRAKRKIQARGGRSGWAAVGMCPSWLFPENAASRPVFCP